MRRRFLAGKDYSFVVAKTLSGTSLSPMVAARIFSTTVRVDPAPVVFVSRDFQMRLLISVTLALFPVLAAAKEPASVETARKEALVLAEAVAKAHAGFRAQLDNGAEFGSEAFKSLLGPLETAVARYDELKQQDEQVSAVNGLGFSTKYNRFGSCRTGGQMLSHVIEGHSTEFPDAAELPAELRYLGATFRNYLLNDIECGLETGVNPVPENLQSLTGLYYEVVEQLEIAEEKLTRLFDLETLPSIETDLAERVAIDWHLSAEIAGGPQSMIAYVGKVNMERPEANYPYSSCSSSLSSFLEIIFTLDQQIQEGRQLNVPARMETAYFQDKAVCKALLLVMVSEKALLPPFLRSN